MTTSERKTIYVDGKTIKTHTTYNNSGGEQKVQSQYVTVRDHKTGKVTSQTSFGGKLIP